MQAKSVYIENKTGDAERGDVFFKELTKWKRFSIVSEKSKADLVFVLGMKTHEAVASNNVRVTNKISDNTSMTTGGGVYSYEDGTVSLDVVDASDGTSVWTNTKSFSHSGATKDLVNDLKNRIEYQERPHK